MGNQDRAQAGHSERAGIELRLQVGIFVVSHDCRDATRIVGGCGLEGKGR